MDHMIKTASLKTSQSMVKGLLILCGVLSASTLLLSLILFNKGETFVVIPTHAPDTRMEISSKGYGMTYLKSWGYHVLGTLMTTSPDTVEQQVSELEAISSSNVMLEAYFKDHIRFIKGSDVSCVFFPKDVKHLDEDHSQSLLIQGTFRYWLGGSDKAVTQDKTYKLSYKTGPHNVLLLDGIEEQGHA